MNFFTYAYKRKHTQFFTRTEKLNHCTENKYIYIRKNEEVLSFSASTRKKNSPNFSEDILLKNQSKKVRSLDRSLIEGFNFGEILKSEPVLERLIKQRY